ncbi:unnamed protein product, partial [Mesorhabditis belari]|uniref:EB domain-containing protein n=1 Tax=Mesorhabditis belari TaxID=2138241 RepID=A0AAF3FAG0_9BILA
MKMIGIFVFLKLSQLALTTCPDTQVSTPCGYVNVFWDCGLASTSVALFTAGVKTNITLEKRCEEIGDNCICGKGLVLDANTQQCRKEIDIHADCFIFLKKVLTATGKMAPKVADSLVSICKNQEAFAVNGTDREYICAQGYLVANEKRFGGKEARCFCGRDDLGLYNGSCVKRAEAVAKCADGRNSTLCQIANQVSTTSACVQVKKFKCGEKAGTGAVTNENVCKIGECYCPDGFVENEAGKCLLLNDALQACIDAFVLMNKSCGASETLLSCQQNEFTFMGCTSTVPPERSATLAILVPIFHDDCRQKNELKCRCNLGFARVPSAGKCISVADVEASCHT